MRGHQCQGSTVAMRPLAEWPLWSSTWSLGQRRLRGAPFPGLQVAFIQRARVMGHQDSGSLIASSHHWFILVRVRLSLSTHLCISLMVKGSWHAGPVVAQLRCDIGTKGPDARLLLVLPTTLTARYIQNCVGLRRTD